MVYVTIVGLLMFVVAVAAPASAQENCIEIDSDLIRLQCFDQWAKENAKPVLPPQEAFMALNAVASRLGFLETANDKSFDMRMATAFGTPCFFEASLTFVSQLGGDPVLSINYGQIDLREVQELRSTNTLTARFVMKRGELATTHAFHNIRLESPLPGPFILNWASERVATDASIGTSDRTVSIPLVMEHEDYREAFSLMQDLVRSCQASEIETN